MFVEMRKTNILKFLIFMYFKGQPEVNCVWTNIRLIFRNHWM